MTLFFFVQMFQKNEKYSIKKGIYYNNHYYFDKKKKK